jgi:tetratricopeptide (TPR) repeat protein
MANPDPAPDDVLNATVPVDTVEVPVLADDRATQVLLQSLKRKMFGQGEPERIGRYVLRRHLGEGGMGVVYLAFDPELGRNVALKLLLGGRDEDARARLVREARSLARLSHPNVVPVFDVGSHEGELYLAMEYVASGDLRDWLRGESRPASAILQVLLAAGRGLAAAHETGVIHRDFKPQNVLIHEDGRAMVADFGLARVDGAEIELSVAVTPEITDDAVLTTRSGSTLGTPAYMSPEQHQGRPADAASDQFAFCITAWEALTGSRPFPGKTRLALNEQVLAGRIEPPARGSLSPHVERVLRRGMSLRPEGRFPDMPALLAALEDDPIRRRRRRLGGVLGVGFVGAVTAGIALWWAPLDACDEAEARVSQLWTPERAVEIAGHLGPEGIAWSDRLAAHTAAIGEAVRAGCGETEDPGDRLTRLACLEERRAEVETLLEMIESGGATTHSLLQRLASRGSSGRLDLQQFGLDDPHLCTDARRRTLPEGAGAKSIRREVQALRIDLARARVFWRGGDLAAARDELTSLARRASEIGYGPAEAEVLSTLGEVLAAQGNTADAVSRLEEAIALATDHGDLELAAKSRAVLLGVRGFQEGSTQSAEAAAKSVRRTAEHLGGERAIKLSAMVELQLSRSLGIAGRLEEALAAAKGAAEIQENAGTPSAEVLAHLGLSHALLGDYGAAEVPVRRAIELLPEQESASVFVYGVKGMLRGFQGDDEEARHHLQRALKLGEDPRRGQSHYASIAASYLSQTELRLGNVERATDLAERGVTELVDAFGDQNPIVGRALLHRGRVHARAGRTAEARADFTRTITVWSRSHGEGHRALALPETALWELDEAVDPEGVSCDRLDRAMDSIERADAADPGHAAENARTAFALARCLRRRGQEARAASLAALAEDALTGLGDGHARDLEAVRDWASGAENDGLRAREKE